MAIVKKKSTQSKTAAKKLPRKQDAKQMDSESTKAPKTIKASPVSANTAVAKSYNEQLLDRVRPYAEAAKTIAVNFESITDKIAALETKMLYKYLGQTFDLYQQIEADLDNKEFFYENLRWHLKSKGIKTNKNTSEISLLIRLIFKVKPKTAHLYSRAIEAASQAQINPKAFIEYVENQGGLEQLRISQVEKDKAKQYRETMKTAHALSWRYLRAMETSPLAVTEIPLNKTHVTTNNFVILVGIGFGQPGNPNQNAEIRILSCLPNAKETDDFVISAIANNFALNITQAENFVKKLEGNDFEALDN